MWEVLSLLALLSRQIFAYTFLDVVAKGVSLSICFCGPAFRLLVPTLAFVGPYLYTQSCEPRMFLSSLGNHQIQSAMSSVSLHGPLLANYCNVHELRLGQPHRSKQHLQVSCHSPASLLAAWLSADIVDAAHFAE